MPQSILHFFGIPREHLKMLTTLAEVDDIRRHGPPKGYTEDGFEKKHASIRNDIFYQNQKQSSRDTAISFSHMTLLNHVISGGYFPVNNDWSWCVLEKRQGL